jgi:hypothetical protein
MAVPYSHDWPAPVPVMLMPRGFLTVTSWPVSMSWSATQPQPSSKYTPAPSPLTTKRSLAVK